MSSISRKWCLIQNDHRNLVVAFEGGEVRTAPMGSEARSLLSECDDFACFTPQPKAVMALCDARYFSGRQRRERLLEVRLDDGPRVCALPPLPLPAKWDEYLLAFSTYCDWLREVGVTFDKRAGWGTIGRRIWKVTDGEVRFNGPTMARLSFYGGRKQAPYPAIFRSAQHFDISAAYLCGIGASDIPTRLRSAPAKEWRTENLDGISYASVSVPSEIGEWLPLPQRADKRIVRLLKFRSGEMEGAWTFSELRMAAEYGCKVEAVRSWAGQHAGPMFAEWHDCMIIGRDLPNLATVFAKQHANLLWSSFATSPSRITTKRWTDEYGHFPKIVKTQEAGKDFSARTAFVSAIVASRIRERLYREVLCPDGIPNLFVVHCDTDGIITGTRHHLPPALQSPDGKPGSWRHTGYYPYAEIRSPNAYRHTCMDCGTLHAEWHYSCAGATNQDSARRLFKNEPRTSAALDLDSLEPECLPDVLAEYKPKRRLPKWSTVGASL